MGRTVSYSAQTLESPNPIARYVHRQRYEASLARVASNARVGGTVLDFGCGNGDFLNILADLRPDLVLLGFDPESDHRPDRYAAVTSMDEVPDASVDVVCCFETLEHLYDDEVAAFLDVVDRVLAPEGEVSISVPVIGGPPLLVKEANRAVLFRRRPDYSFRELMAASFAGRPAPRPADIRVSHKGFDFRALLAVVSERFAVDDMAYTPFPALAWWLNSQVFVRLRRRS